MSKHTPGPWRVDGTRIVSETAHMEFCPDLPVTVVDCHGAMGGEDTQADKRLIAAAPDLLAALIALVDATNQRSLAYDEAVVAIQKATEP